MSETKGILRPSRRGFLVGIAGLLAAPAIVRVSSLMPIKALPAGYLMPQLITNIDIIYGYLYVNPEWALHTIVQNNFLFEETLP